MPTLYLYLGIRVYFYANEHSPIHVHGEYQGKESKAEIFAKDGKIEEIRYMDVAEVRPLPAAKLRDFKALVEHEALNIVKTWEAMFEQGTIPKIQRITRKIK